MVRRHGEQCAVLQNIKPGTAMRSGNSTPGCTLQITEKQGLPEMCALVHNSQTRKQPRCLQRDEQCVANTFNGMLLSLKKEGSSDTGCSVDEPGGRCAQ